MRYTPSPAAALCIVIIIAALLANFMLINPAYDAALANHRTLKAQLTEARAQQQRPLTDDQRALALRLQAPDDAKPIIAALTAARAAAPLGDITYTIGPAVPQPPFSTQRVDVTTSAATDAALWPFIRAVVDQTKLFLRTTDLHITRTTDGVQATATFVRYRWAE